MSIYVVLSLALLNATSVFGARVALTLYAVELGAQPLTIGILAATFSALPLLLSMPAGKLADRFGSRWLLIVVTGLGALGMLAPYLAPGLPAIFAAAALVGLSLGIFVVSLQTMVGLLSSLQHRTLNFSNFTLAMTVGMAVGPLIAGFSIDHSNHASTCLYLALFSLAPAAILARAGVALRGGAPRQAHARGGIRDALSDPGVRRALAAGSLMSIGQDLYQIYMPVYAHGIGLSAFAIGIVLSINSIAMIAVRLVLLRLIVRFREEKLLAYAFYVGAASLMLMPLFKGAVMLSLISFLFGLGMGCCGPISIALMFSSSAEGRSGEAMGLRMTVIHFTKLVGPVVFGSIGSAFGLIPMFWLNALMMGAGGMFSAPRKTG